MACCGKGALTAPVNDPVVMSGQARKDMIVPLEGYEENQLEWVAYMGGKQARFDILARGPANLPSSYTIFGTGQVFQIHKQHHNIFAGRQRQGFRMNQPDPRNREEVKSTPAPHVETAIELPPPPEPEMSTIVRLDSVAAQTVEADVQPMPDKFAEIEFDDFTTEIEVDEFAEIERDYLQRQGIGSEEVTIQPGPEPSVSFIPNPQEIIEHIPLALSDLGLSPKAIDTLAADTIRQWTVEKLARTTPQLLSAYPGIGIKTANKIIEKAQELISET